MKFFRMRRAWAVVATVALAAAMTPVLFAGSASADTATVSTEAEFWAAWTDPFVLQIDLAANIDLHSGAGNGTCSPNSLPERYPDDATLVDGHGFTLRQMCSPNTTLFTYGTYLLTVQNITITHGPGIDGTGIYNEGDVTVINSTITGNHGISNICSDSADVSAAWLCSTSGGGVYSRGVVTITDSTVSDNSIEDTQAVGGGIYAQDGLTVTNSTVSDNKAEGTGYAVGGGAYSIGGSVITGSSFTGNSAFCPGECTPMGGGLASEGGDTTVTSSNFVGNSANCEMYCGNVGGGILSGSGNLSLAGSFVSQNGVQCEDSCEAAGAGIFSQTGYFYDAVPEAAGRGVQTAITDSTVSDNFAFVTDEGAGNCDCSGAGAVIDGHEALFLTRSTFSNNTALWDGGAIDIWEDYTQVRIENSTITGNHQAYDGAIDAWDAPVTTVYSTIAGNVTTEIPAEASAAGSNYGRGEVHASEDLPRPANLSAGSLTTFGTVFAMPTGGPNCLITGESETANSEGYNFSDDASCGLTAATDKQDAGSPMLNVLADNGGPTATMMPYTPKSNGAASPLIDAIPVAACQTGTADGVGTDQRGVARPQLQGCDIGAVEVTGEEYQVEALVVTPRFTG